MTAKITSDALKGYLNCKYKGHLKQVGEHGNRSDYEAMLIERREAIRLRAIDKILSRHGEDEVARNVHLTVPVLKRGPLFVLNAVLEDEIVSIQFDALIRVDGSSKLGDFHYIPVLFHEGQAIRKEQKRLGMQGDESATQH